MRSIRRPEVYEETVRKLAEQSHPGSGKSMFGTMRELVCFAAALGFEARRRLPLAGATNEIDARIFERSDAALDLLYLIALSEEKKTEVLLPEQEELAVRIFEEYVAGGLALIDEWMKGRPDDEHGDQAMLAGLQASGLLKAPEPKVDDVISDIRF